MVIDVPAARLDDQMKYATATRVMKNRTLVAMTIQVSIVPSYGTGTDKEPYHKTASRPFLAAHLLPADPAFFPDVVKLLWACFVDEDEPPALLPSSWRFQKTYCESQQESESRQQQVKS